MNKEFIAFGKIEIEKRNLIKNLILLKDIDTDNIHGYLVLFLLVKKNINAFFVIKMMIIKLKHCA